MKFKDYLDVRLHIARREKEQGKDYYCTQEYKELWPIADYLYHREYGEAAKAKRLLRKQIKEDGIKYGLPIALFM